MNPLLLLLKYAEAIIFVIAAVAGIAAIPLAAMALGSLLPAFIAEPLASMMMKLTASADGGGRIHQTETDEYVWQGLTGDESPRNYFTRFLGQPFGISWERSKAALRGRVEHEDPSALVTDGGSSLPGKREVRDIERGGVKTFMDCSQDAGLFVRIGEKLSELRDTDGLDVVSEAQDQTMKEEAGAGRMETKWRVIFWMGMAFFGFVGGIGVFFVL